MKKGQEICGKILKIVLKSFTGYVLKILDFTLFALFGNFDVIWALQIIRIGFRI